MALRFDRFITLVKPSVTTDTEGFSSKTDITQAQVRAYREGRHGSRKWANRAAFSEATDLYCFRVIPNLTITTDMQILDGNLRWEITSVENIKGRNMYVECLVKEVKPCG